MVIFGGLSSVMMQPNATYGCEKKFTNADYLFVIRQQNIQVLISIFQVYRYKYSK